jgi:hypothetical protein
MSPLQKSDPKILIFLWKILPNTSVKLQSPRMHASSGLCNVAFEQKQDVSCAASPHAGDVVTKAVMLQFNCSTMMF